MLRKFEDRKENITNNLARLKLTAEYNCQIRSELLRNLAIMEALKSFIRRRIATRRVEAKVLRAH